MRQLAVRIITRLHRGRSGAPAGSVPVVLAADLAVAPAPLSAQELIAMARTARAAQQADRPR